MNLSLALRHWLDDGIVTCLDVALEESVPSPRIVGTVVRLMVRKLGLVLLGEITKIAGGDLSLEWKTSGSPGLHSLKHHNPSPWHLKAAHQDESTCRPCLSVLPL